MSAPQRRPELTYEEIEATGELIVVDPADDRACVLNPTAAAVWLLCDGSRDVAAIAAEIADVLGDAAPGRAQLVADVERCVGDLTQERLLST